MSRCTAATQPPAAGSSCQEQPQPNPRLPYPPLDFTVAPRRPPPYPTKGYQASSHPHHTHTKGRFPPPQPSQPTGPQPAADLLPDSDETFRILLHRSLLSHPTPSARNSYGRPACIPSSSSRWWTQQQPSKQTHSPLSRPFA